ncbi:hypothetical protein BK010_01090 [Tenericutes bacterium MO-XQ]|jgi:hypothetical protein|nr:hypothetical protein BK010_01090 [Tenericutes bacterium MO-XQ]
MNYQVNDTITLKKKHVCGSYDWVVIRTGAEIKIRCVKCNREVMILKKELDRRIKTIKSQQEQ